MRKSDGFKAFEKKSNRENSKQDTWICTKCQKNVALTENMCQCGYRNRMLEKASVWEKVRGPCENCEKKIIRVEEKKELPNEKITKLCLMCQKPSEDTLCSNCKRNHFWQKEPPNKKMRPTRSLKKIQKSCLSCQKPSEGILCSNCKRNDFWQCVFCSSINKGSNICNFCRKQDAKRKPKSSGLPVRARHY